MLHRTIAKSKIESIACKYFVLLHVEVGAPLILPCRSPEEQDWLAGLVEAKLHLTNTTAQ